MKNKGSSPDTHMTPVILKLPKDQESQGSQRKVSEDFLVPQKKIFPTLKIKISN